MYIKAKIKWGEILLSVEEDGSLSGLWFVGQKYFPLVEEDIYDIDSELDFTGLLIARTVLKQLEAYGKGTRDTFDIPLSPKGTDFQKMVWEVLLKIPQGMTVTYGDIAKDLAKKMGRESMSAQAVGGAVGHNPISVIVPCHRVIGAKGQVTGYAGGIDKKIALLKHEGVLLKD